MSLSISSSEAIRVEPPVINSTRQRFFLKTVVFISFIFALDFGADAVLSHGLRRYFGMNGHADVLCIGHSRTMLGIDAELFSQTLGLKTAKYAINGANIADRYAMVRHFLSEHPEVRVLIYDVESTLFSNEKLSSNSYRLFFPFIENKEISSFLQSQNIGPDDYWLRRIFRSSRYDEVTTALSARGLMGLDKNLKFGRFDPARARRWLEQGKNRPVRIVEPNLNVFMETLDYATSRGVQVLLVDMPSVDVMNHAERPDSEAVRAVFRGLPAKYSNVTYMDLSRAYEHHYEIFHDMIHVNAKGQKIVTAVVAAKTLDILKQNPGKIR